MIPPIFAIVAASPSVTALLGTPPTMRFYNFGEATQLTPKPYAVWQLITGIPANYINQLPDMDDTRIQVDVYDDDAATARAIASAIRNAIEPHAHMVSFADRGRDATTRNYGFMMDFEFFTPR